MITAIHFSWSFEPVGFCWHTNAIEFYVQRGYESPKPSLSPPHDTSKNFSSRVDFSIIQTTTIVARTGV